MDVGDCSTDGSCGDDDSSISETDLFGVKLAPTSLTEETVNALQQFSIGKEKSSEKRRL